MVCLPAVVSRTSIQEEATSSGMLLRLFQISQSAEGDRLYMSINIRTDQDWELLVLAMIELWS